MEGLANKFDNFKQCYKALGNVIELQGQLEISAASNPVMQNLITAGVIKHFELTYETAWKFLKEYLANVYNCEALSPKQVFRECEKYKIFSTIILLSKLYLYILTTLVNQCSIK